MPTIQYLFFYLVIQYLYLNNYYTVYSYIPNNNNNNIVMQEIMDQHDKNFLTVEFTKGDGLCHLQV
jgi:hypothetical protein